jgi:hypothetical protein
MLIQILHNRTFLCAGAACLVATIGLVACGSTPVTAVNEVDVMATIVAATLTARPTDTAPPPQPTDTPSPELTSTSTSTPVPSETPTVSPTLPEKNVSGRICYPEEGIPEMVAYFEETEAETVVELQVAAAQDHFEIKLDPGTYIAYAWTKDFTRGGLYSQAVPCGMGPGCDDHNLLTFTVKPGELLSDIDLCDWYAFHVPYPPGKEIDAVTGAISGNILFQDGEPPGLRVVAFNTDTTYWYWVFTRAGQSAYSLAELPPGTYHVVAYTDDGQAAGHASSNHTLIDVLVKPGETTQGIDINDWDAPADSFPDDPTR